MLLLTPRKCVRTAGGRMEEGPCLFSRNSQKMFKSKVEKAGDLWPVIFGLSFSSRFCPYKRTHARTKRCSWPMFHQEECQRHCLGRVTDMTIRHRNFWDLQIDVKTWPLNPEFETFGRWSNAIVEGIFEYFWSFRKWRSKTFRKKTPKKFQPWQVWKGSFASTFQFGQWPRWGSHGHLPSDFQNGPRWRHDKICNRRLKMSWMRLEELGCKKILTGFHGWSKIERSR